MGEQYTLGNLALSEREFLVGNWLPAIIQDEKSCVVNIPDGGDSVSESRISYSHIHCGRKRFSKVAAFENQTDFVS